MDEKTPWAQGGLAAESWLIQKFEELSDEETVRDKFVVTPVREWLGATTGMSGASLSSWEQVMGDVLLVDVEGRANSVEVVFSKEHPDSFSLGERKLQRFAPKVRDAYFAFVSPAGEGESSEYTVRFFLKERVLEALRDVEFKQGNSKYKVFRIDSVDPDLVISGIRSFYDKVLARPS